MNSFGMVITMKNVAKSIYVQRTRSLNDYIKGYNPLPTMDKPYHEKGFLNTLNSIQPPL